MSCLAASFRAPMLSTLGIASVMAFLDCTPPVTTTHLRGSILELASARAFDVSGGSLAQLDPTKKQLIVYTFSPDTTPAPTCGMLGHLDLLKKGTVVALTVNAFERRVATFPGYSLGYVTKADEASAPKAAGNEIDTAQFRVEAISPTSISVSVTSPPNAGSPVNGSILATFCPDGSPSANREPTTGKAAEAESSFSTPSP